MILHEYSASGNCYKVRLTAAHLGISVERQEYNIFRGETRTPEFLETINPNGRIPVLQVGQHYLPESNAICFYLAADSDLVPKDRLNLADMLRWMFFEQYNHEPNVATMYVWRKLGEDRISDAQRALIPSKMEGARAAFNILNQQLARHDFLVGARFSLADIILYAYSHVAEEVGIELGDYPAVREWLARIAAQHGHIGSVPLVPLLTD